MIKRLEGVMGDANLYKINNYDITCKVNGWEKKSCDKII